MGLIEQYRLNAERARRIARKTADEETRRVWLHIADEWILLAKAYQDLESAPAKANPNRRTKVKPN